jgi:hypothetical protein
MLSFASIFGDDVKREYLSAQNLRLHFLSMIFEAGSLHLSNCMLVLGYGESSTCSYRLRSSHTTPAANTGWLTGQRGARGALVGRLILDWISHVAWPSLSSVSGIILTFFNWLVLLHETKLYTIFYFRIFSEFSSPAASWISLSKSSQAVTI